MEIKIIKELNFVLVCPKGRIDAVNCGGLQEKMEDLIDNGENRLLLNLADVDYISSAGLRVILTIAKRLYTDGAFAIVSPKPSVHNILEVVGLANIINIYDGIEKARKEINIKGQK